VQKCGINDSREEIESCAEPPQQVAVTSEITTEGQEFKKCKGAKLEIATWKFRLSGSAVWE
jgi:hypothetical protein